MANDPGGYIYIYIRWSDESGLGCLSTQAIFFHPVHVYRWGMITYIHMWMTLWNSQLSQYSCTCIHVSYYYIEYVRHSPCKMW